MVIKNSTFQFLKDLKNNNDREWFNAHKDRYLAAKENFDEFVHALIQEIAKFDSQVAHLHAKDCVFRIYRDVRFSKDKSPYKTHFGAHISPVTKKSLIHTRAGYYLHLSPGDSMLAGGAYKPESPWLRSIRESIYNDPQAFKKIINKASFKKYFGSIEGEKLKRPPKDFPGDHPDIELLKHKSFLVTHKLTNKEVLSKDFLKLSGKIFKALAPFDDFLNKHTN